MKQIYILFFLLTSYSYSQTLVDVIDLPAGAFWNGGYGMVHENSKYWISSSWNSGGVANGIFYAVDNNGNLIDTVMVINYPTLKESQGLAFDGLEFWYVERKTARCDLFRISSLGEVLDSIPTAELFGSSSYYLGGAAWDGSGLWISVYSPDASAALYKVNVASRQIVDTIPVFGLQPQGITIKGDTLFYVMDGFQGDPEKIYAVNLTTKDTLFSFHVPEAPGVRQNPRGLAWDGSFFWLMAEPVGASSGRQLFKYDLGGNGTPQIYTPSTNLIFSNTTVGNSSNFVVQIFNNGSAPLSVDSIKVNGNVFSINPVSLPVQILPGNSISITINFTPVDYAFYQGSVSIYSNDPVTPVVTINLSGRGLLPGARIGITESSHNFGNIWVGEEAITFWKFKIFNKGNSTLGITNIQFGLPEYTFTSPSIPFNIISTDSVEITVYFYPQSIGNYTDSLRISNNDITNQLVKIPVQGAGIFNNYNFGYTFWQYQVPPHPNSSSAEPRVEGLKYINDITGDGIPEVIISTENYWTMCLDGAASGETYPLWIFTTYISSSNAGSIGANFEYGVQDAIQIANDLNGDGFNDVVIAVGGGNEHVYAINGKTGQIIWSFGDDINYSLGDFQAVDVQHDFNGDEVEDVLAIADGNDQGTGYKRAFLFNGVNGNIIWQYYYPGPNPSFGKSIISIKDINGDIRPDVIIGYGNNGSSDLSVAALNGQTGQPIWTRNMVLYEPKEILELPLSADSSDIIVGEYFNRVHRINARTGEIVWTYPLGSSAAIIQMSLIDDINNDFVPDILVASFAGNGLNCLSGKTGLSLWSYYMDYQFGVTSVPDLNGDGISDVIVGDRTGTLFCISGKGDSLIFSHNFPGDWIYTVNSMPSIDGNNSNEIITGTKNGKVVCFSGGTLAVPVELTLFSGYEFDGKVFLQWSTGSEINNYGFEIERSFDSKSDWKRIGFLPGHGTASESKSYSFKDENINTGKYFYRLKQIDYNGSFTYSNTVEINIDLPSTYSLEQNFPNPFNPATTIRFTIPKDGRVKLSIYNLLAEEVAVLLDEHLKAGFHQVEWNGIDKNNKMLSSGAYFYRLEAGDFVEVKKMMLMK